MRYVHDAIQTSEDGNYSWCCLWYVCKGNIKCGKESTFDIGIYPKYFNDIVKKPDCFDAIEQVEQKLEEQQRKDTEQRRKDTEQRQEMERRVRWAKEMTKKHGI